MRRTEIIPLADFFIQKHATAYELDIKPLSHAAQKRLQSYAFPGNIRELSHMMERAILLCDGTEIEESALSLKSVVTTEQCEPEMMTLDQAEQKLIKMALCQCMIMWKMLRFCLGSVKVRYIVALISSILKRDELAYEKA